MTRSVDQAIAAAQSQSQHGPQFGTGWCLKEVQGLYAVPPRDPDATTGWARTTMRHPGDRKAPRGGICWWTGGSAGHGHVALSAGGGRIWSTDIRRPGYFDLVPLSDIETKWGLAYAGWSEDIEGVRVYGGDTPPPAPRKRHKRTYFVDLHPTYQHGFDFKAARAAGIRAAAIKCTDGEHGSYGTGYTDMVKGAQGNDMGVAAYHWLYGGDAAYIRAQALNLAAHIGDKSIPVFVDVEKSAANSANIGHLVEFTAAARSLGLTVVVDYLPRWYWTSLGSPSLARVDLTLWNSAYGPNLPLPPKAARVANVSPGRWSDMGGKHVRLLQFGSRVKVGGMAVDCSVYRGPVTHLARWFKMPQATPPPPPPPPPPVPAAVTLDAATWNVYIKNHDPAAGAAALIAATRPRVIFAQEAENLPATVGHFKRVTAVSAAGDPHEDDCAVLLHKRDPIANAYLLPGTPGMGTGVNKDPRKPLVVLTTIGGLEVALICVHPPYVGPRAAQATRDLHAAYAAQVVAEAQRLIAAGYRVEIGGDGNHRPHPRQDPSFALWAQLEAAGFTVIRDVLDLIAFDPDQITQNGKESTVSAADTGSDHNALKVPLEAVAP